MEIEVHHAQRDIGGQTLDQSNLGQAGLTPAGQESELTEPGPVLLAPLTIPRLPATTLLVEDETISSCA